MATWSGCSPPDSLRYDPVIATPLGSLDPPFDPTARLFDQPGSACGGFTSAQPTTAPVITFTGCGAKGFFDDYYFRVHVLPHVIDLGFLTQPETRNVEVWNAWLTPQTASSRTESGTGGVVIDNPVALPFEWKPLKSVMYEVAIGTEGPPIIDAYYNWVFPTEVVGVNIIGVRVVVFALRHNWRQKLKEKQTWGVVPMPSYNGAFQHYSSRSTPRRTFESQHLLVDKGKRFIEALQWYWSEKAYVIPLWSQITLLQADAAAGATEILVDTTYSHFHTGGFVTLIHGYDSQELRVIDSVLSDRVTLTEPLTQAWNRGTEVYPSVTARMSEAPKYKVLNDRIGELSCVWEISQEPVYQASKTGPYLLAPVDNPSENEAEHNNSLMYVREPDWAQGVNTSAFADLVEEAYPTRQVDFRQRKSALADATLQMGWTLTTREDIYHHLRLLRYLQGSMYSLYLPTWQSDLKLVVPVTTNRQELEVEYVDYVKRYGYAPGRVRIRLTGVCSTGYFEMDTYITSVVAGGTPATEKLSIAHAVPGDILQQHLSALRISFLVLSEQIGNTDTFVWSSPSLMVHQMSAKMRKLEQ